MGVLCNGICQAIRSSDIIYKGWQRAVPQIMIEFGGNALNVAIETKQSLKASKILWIYRKLKILLINKKLVLYALLMMKIVLM